MKEAVICTTAASTCKILTDLPFTLLRRAVLEAHGALRIAGPGWVLATKQAYCVAVTCLSVCKLHAGRQRGRDWSGRLYSTVLLSLPLRDSVTPACASWELVLPRFEPCLLGPALSGCAPLQRIHHRPLWG